MVHSINSVGIHVILVPSTDTYILPRHRQPDLSQIATEIAMISGCAFKSLHVCTDHVHVLFVSSDEQAVNTFLPAFADRAAECIAGDHPHEEVFEWSERIHVTLLPPWHVEILASFVRDQDNFHRTRTLQQELDEIFLPNAAGVVEADAPPSDPSPHNFH